MFRCTQEYSFSKSGLVERIATKKLLHIYEEIISEIQTADFQAAADCSASGDCTLPATQHLQVINF